MKAVLALKHNEWYQPLLLSGEYTLLNPVWMEQLKIYPVDFLGDSRSSYRDTAGKKCTRMYGLSKDR